MAVSSPFGGIKITPSPRMIIKMIGRAGEDVCELEKAGYIFDLDDRIVTLEGQRVDSYDELVRLAMQDKYKNNEYIEVLLLPAVAGG